MPNFVNSSANCTGYSTVSFSSVLTCSRPPTSAQLTSGTSTTDSRSDDGLHVLAAAAKCFLFTSSAPPSSANRAASASQAASWRSSSNAASPDVSASASLKASRTQSSAASVQSCARSAPTKPWQSRATSARSTSAAMAVFFVLTLRISPRAASSGTSSATSRSRRPKRRTAASRSFGLPVAASTTTPLLARRPSISVRSCAQTRLSCSESALSRF
mmetsp:Transcript_1517/g.4643  ORF Transcript_1517/g.4643 Transcript_1517/m.4643 type:complete len:216 (+) Transcript_1517:1241-1888(+)